MNASPKAVAIAEATEYPLSAVKAAIEGDSRTPDENDISGAWMTNPRIDGPSKKYMLTQRGTEIHGKGISYGCTGASTYTITGKRTGDKITLIETDDQFIDLSFTCTYVLLNTNEGIGLQRSDIEKPILFDIPTRTK